MPRNGASLGPQHTQLIYYYDDRDLNDVDNSYSTLNGYRPPATWDLYWSLPLDLGIH